MVGELVEAGALGMAVAGRDPQRVDPGEDVELGDRQRGHAVQAGGVAQADGVEPAAAARRGRWWCRTRRRPSRPARRPRRARRSASSISLGNGSGADARGVGLGDAPDLVDGGGADAGADAGGAGDRVRRGDEGIGAVVEVEHRRLGALEEHGLLAVERVPAEPGGVGDVRLEAVPVGEALLGHRVQVEVAVLGEGPQQLALRLHRGHDLLAQDLRVEEVLDPDPEPQRLVRVAGADAALRRADLELAELRLARRGRASRGRA